MEQKLLVVKWNEMEGASYYIDKDSYSKAHERKTKFILNSYSGTYSFDKNTKKVTLDTGVEIRAVTVLDWHIEFEME